MKTCLLDVNVLLALAWPNHVHHESAHDWFGSVKKRRWASCLVTELGFIRLSSNPRFSPHFKSPSAAREVLSALRTIGTHEYWRESPEGICSTNFDDIYENVLTHEHVTDGYLVAMAMSTRGKLATFDQALSRLFPLDVELLLHKL